MNQITPASGKQNDSDRAEIALAAAVGRREAAIRELAEAVSAFPDNVRAQVKAAVIAANEQREAELARREAADRPGFSPGF